MVLDLKRCLAAARHLAENAGALLRETSDLRARQKGRNPHDFVTTAEEQAERMIRRRLSHLFPAHAFHGEESHEAGARIDPEVPTWLVDPIDGTTNFVRGVPYYCTSIGLWYQGKPQVGVVHEIPTCRIYSARRDGEFAWVDSRQELKVSKVDTLAQAIVATEWPADNQTRGPISRAMLELGMQAVGLRVMSSSTLGVCHVAAGVFDAHFTVGVHPWDIAAAALFVEMAGGKITDEHGRPWTLESPVVVTTNGRIHDLVVETLRKNLEP